MFKQMTILEKTMIQNNSFETLWNDLWKPASNNDFYINLSKNKTKNDEKIVSENILKTKFNYIKHHHLKRYIDSSLLFGHWIEPEWDFPKGRKN